MKDLWYKYTSWQDMILHLKNACWQTSKGRRQKADCDSLLYVFFQFLPQLRGQKEKITWILLTTESQRVVKISPTPFQLLAYWKLHDKWNSGITVIGLQHSTVYEWFWLAGKEGRKNWNSPWCTIYLWYSWQVLCALRCFFVIQYLDEGENS